MHLVTTTYILMQLPYCNAGCACNINGLPCIIWSRPTAMSALVSYPDHTPEMNRGRSSLVPRPHLLRRVGLVTVERFLGLAESAVLKTGKPIKSLNVTILSYIACDWNRARTTRELLVMKMDARDEGMVDSLNPRENRDGIEIRETRTDLYT